MSVSIDAQGIRAMLPEIDQIEDPALRSAITDIWQEVAAEMAWDRFEDIPKNLKAEMYRPLIPHIRGVTQMALRLAETAQELHGTPYDRDLLIAACLLHDASKPLECEPDPEGAPTGGPARPGRTSAIGRNIQHAVYAAHKALEKGLPLEHANQVITHTPTSGVRGNTWEAALVFYADFADTDAGISTSPIGGTSYTQRWKLG
jgi:putative nucleotidyltransferase with HDIG domain